MTRHGRRGLAFATFSLVAVMAVSTAEADKKDVPFFQKPSLLPERDAEKRAAELATPQVLRPPLPMTNAPLRTVRVRVYGDLDYRGITPRWQARFRSLLQRVNAFIEPGFSVHVEVQALHSWDRRSAGGSLQESLAALAAMDPGNDADWVIGLVSPLAGFTNDLHELGRASVLGKHFVLRSADDPGEAASIEQNLHRLTDNEREGLYGSRKQHRETIIFLHEWAHTLGALHDLEPDRIMNGTYRLSQISFSEDNVRIMRLALDGIVGPSFDLGPLVGFVEAHPLDDARSQDRAQLLDMLRARVGPRAPSANKPASGSGVTASAAPPPSDLAAVVRKLLADGHRSEARERVDAARRRALAQPDQPAAFLTVAAGYRALGAITLTEEALARTGDGADTKELSQWTRTTRAHAGLPKNGAAFKITVEDEAEYLEFFNHIDERLHADDQAAAATLVREGLGRYPGAPGLLALRCDVELRASKTKVARQTCQAALGADEGVARAHHLLAAMDLDAGNREAARIHLMRAITLDPDNPDTARMFVRLHR